MNQQDFFSNALDFFKSGGYAFYIPEGPLDNLEKHSGVKRTLYHVATATAIGLLGGLYAPGYSDETHKESLKKDLKEMYNFCDLAGIHLSSGMVVLRLIVDGDNLSDEAIVGRFAMIHERVFDFRKYGASFLKTIYSNNRLLTSAFVLVAFSSHKRSKDFINNFADKCEHKEFWKKVHTHAWVIDLEDEEITRFPEPLIDLGRVHFQKIKAGLFNKNKI